MTYQQKRRGIVILVVLSLLVLFVLLAVTKCAEIPLRRGAQLRNDLSDLNLHSLRCKPAVQSHSAIPRRCRRAQRGSTLLRQTARSG